MNVADGLERVLARIRRAATAAVRSPESVRLIAVSKTHPPAAIREAYAAGQRDFGENYAQELLEKAEALRDLADLRWHMIGHLQRNKVPKLLPHLHCLHTVDSVALARELGKRSSGQRRLSVLVEVAIAGEAQKSGVALAELPQVLSAVEAEPALLLQGLMCVPPATQDPEGARPHFEALQRLRSAQGGPARLPELSIGMSFDLECAVAAGATWVRVGTAVFGLRPTRPE